MNEDEHTLLDYKYSPLWWLIIQRPISAMAMKKISQTKFFSSLDSELTMYSHIKFLELYHAMVRTAISGKNIICYTMSLEDIPAEYEFYKIREAIKSTLEDIGFYIRDVRITDNGASCEWIVSWRADEINYLEKQ